MYKIYPESSHILLGSENIKKYIHGGRGVVTLKAPSGKKHTYIFAKPKNSYGFPDDVLFVFALHEGKKQFYVGMVEKDQFRLTQNSRFLPDTEIVKGAKYIMKMANIPGFETPMELYHEGMCCFCGRQLKSTKSMSVGIGPKCMKMEGRGVEIAHVDTTNSDNTSKKDTGICGQEIKTTSNN